MANAVWNDPNLPPPKEIKINGVPEQENLSTRAINQVEVTFNIKDALRKVNKARVYVLFTGDHWKTQSFHVVSEWYFAPQNSGPTFSPETFFVTLSKLTQNTHYECRMWTEVPTGRSMNFNSFDFWTNRQPTRPVIILPRDNTTFITGENIHFQWSFSDPDGGDSQAAYQLRWRNVFNAPGVAQQAGPWNMVVGTTQKERFVPGTNFRANRYYEWQIQYRDPIGLWSEWSTARSFYVKGDHSPPLARTPTNDTALDLTEQIRFTWTFRDPESGDAQARADLRYRAVGASDSEWTTIDNAAGTNAFYLMPPDTLLPGVHYEWQVQTYDRGSGSVEPSGWSNLHTFYAIRPPGELAQQPLFPGTIIKGALGCGHNRVFVYQQGGKVKVGEITPLTQIVWRRQRDDISNCIVDTNGWGPDCGDLLSRLRSWQHELVVFRDGVRVWEGPITRVTYTVDNVEIEAKDVMGYVYRRILRQGWDDSYNCTNRNPDCRGGTQTGLNTVVYRATRIITDALGRGDPNVLPYLTPIVNTFDARQSKIVPDFSMTAWEAVDDLAATAGLDYTTVGRRILLWDTHFPIGKLPEMRDGDFSDPVIVTEYGMNTCNLFAVTDGTGIWGAAYPLNTVPPPSKPPPGKYGSFDFYGMVEMVASSYGDSEDDINVGTATTQSLNESRAKFATQASKNIGHRWPTPVVVRVPDNTTINPDVNIDINHLVPGAWVPLRSTATLREIAQWQKLDSVTVTETPQNETVQVVMSPAPNDGDDDPDSTGANTET